MKHSLTAGIVIVAVGTAYSIYNVYEIRKGLRLGMIEFKADSSEGGGDDLAYDRYTAPLRYFYHLIRFSFGLVGGIVITLIGLLYVLWII